MSIPVNPAVTYEERGPFTATKFNVVADTINGVDVVALQAEVARLTAIVDALPTREDITREVIAELTRRMRAIGTLEMEQLR